MRRLAEKIIIALSYVSSLLTIVIFAVFLGFLVWRGLETLNLELLFGNVSPYDAIFKGIPVWDGVWPAMVGTAFLVFISCAIALPVGISAGVFLSEYATISRWRSSINFGVDLLAGMPSIVMGLFGFAMIMLLRASLFPEATTCLLLASACIALLVLPYIIRTTQTALEGLPLSLRFTGASLGFTKWQNIFFVLLPYASRGILSGVILAIGRAAEDTAVILLTGVVANSGLPGSLTDKFEALPFSIFYLAAEHRTAEELNRGFGSALLLLILTALLFQAANWFHGRIAKGWR